METCHEVSVRILDSGNAVGVNRVSRDLGWNRPKFGEPGQSPNLIQTLPPTGFHPLDPQIQDSIPLESELILIRVSRPIPR